MRVYVVLAACLIASCAACTDSTQKLGEILATTHVIDTVSLYEYDGTSSSASGGGGNTFAKSLYGTQRSYEDVVYAYSEQLLGDGWEQSNEATWRKTQPDGLYKITVENISDWVGRAGIDTIPPDVIAKGYEDYETLFIVSTYHIP